VKRVTTGAAAR
jgi:hypothetical protein